MSDQIELTARVKTDAQGDEYYVIVSDMPVMIDVSKSVLFIFHPREGDSFAKLVVRPRFPSRSHHRHDHKPEDYASNGHVNGEETHD